MDRKANYFFTLSLIAIFVLQGNAEEHARIMAGALLALIFCIIAFVARWLTLDGAYAAATAGAVVFGLGGYPAAIVLMLFFISSTLISRNEVISEGNPGRYRKFVRRDGLQVWSNGFWFSFFLAMGFSTQLEIFYIASLGAIATATADTWATELGSRRFEANTYLIGSFQKVAAGSEGGISWPGTLAALSGSLLIAIAAALAIGLQLSIIFIIFLSGFSGCLADSYFGATFQRNNAAIKLPALFSADTFQVDNNMVNWLSTGVGSLLAIIFKLLLI